MVALFMVKFIYVDVNFTILAFLRIHFAYKRSFSIIFVTRNQNVL